MLKKESSNNGKQLLEDEVNMDLEIEEFLASYTVEKVEDEDIENTVEVLRSYMPKKKKSSNNITFPYMSLIKNEITYINKIYWIGSLIFIVIGLSFVSINKASPYNYLLQISPIPIILGILEVLKGSEDKVWELEMSFKYSFRQLVLVRLLIVMCFSALINIFLMVMFFKTIPEMTLLKLFFSWITPFSLVGTGSLIIVSKFRTKNSVILCLSIWSIIAIYANEYFAHEIEAFSSMFTLAFIGASVGIFIYSVYVFYKKMIRFDEKIEGYL